MIPKLKINFILPTIRKTGGILVALEYARQLRMLGHEVRVYYPFLPSSVYFKNVPAWKRFPHRMKSFFWNLLNRAALASQLPYSRDLHGIPFITGLLISDADVTIATAWPTAYDVAALPRSKGEKFYFVQDYEIWHGEKERVDASYLLPLKLFVISPWLEELMRVKFSRWVTAEIHNGVELDFFRPGDSRTEGTTSILMMYHVLKGKGISDGLEILHRIHKLHADIKIRMFGMYSFPEKPDFIEYLQNPSKTQLLELYQTSQIFLFPSLIEGWGLPIVEAMACGCAVVTTNVGCVPVLKGEGNLLWAEPGNKEMLFQHIERLIQNPDEIERMAKMARESVLSFDWKVCGKRFEQAIVSSLRSES